MIAYSHETVCKTKCIVKLVLLNMCSSIYKDNILTIPFDSDAANDEKMARDCRREQGLLGEGPFVFCSSFCCRSHPKYASPSDPQLI